MGSTPSEIETDSPSDELAYVQRLNLSYLSCGSGNFVMFNKYRNELLFFSENEDKPPPLVYGSFPDEFTFYVLEEAKSNGAKLTTINDICYCEIGDFTESGETYIKAAINALATFNNHKSKNP